MSEQSWNTERVEVGSVNAALQGEKLAESATSTAGRGRRRLWTNLDIGFEFVIVAEVNDVVAAVVGTPFTTQALGMDRKQKRCPANPYVRIINRGFDRVHREI
jgi:hypothetical protein